MCASSELKCPCSDGYVLQTDGYAATTGTAQGLLTSILELGAWLGTLFNGYLADAVGRRVCALIACVVFMVGVIVQACTQNKDYVFAGRFVTGLGVGSLSMIVPLYNAELVCYLCIYRSRHVLINAGTS